MWHFDLVLAKDNAVIMKIVTRTVFEKNGWSSIATTLQRRIRKMISC